METPALIFDEVDVGISGPTAAVVGNCCVNWANQHR
jgi:DNA repair ATPase RecN